MNSGKAACLNSFATLLLTAFPAAAISTGFNTTLEGWTGIDIVGGVPTHQAAGGNPGGYLFIDNAESVWAFVIAPAAFLGNLTTFSGGTISFDGNQPTGNGLYSHSNDYGHIFTSGGGLTASRDLAPGTVAAGTWVSYSAPFTAAGFGVTPANWNTILANVTDIRVSLERTFGAETNGVDNFALTAPDTSGVPEPGGLPPATIGAALLAVRRRA